MHLTCPGCGAAIDADDVNLDTAMAKCAACDNVFSFGDAVGGAGGADEASAQPRAPVEMPKKWTVNDIGQALEIRYSWFGAKVFGLLFFAVFWNGFMVVWHYIAITEGEWIMSLFGVLHTIVGVAVGYGVLCGFLNATTIRIGMGMMEITHGPLPCWGNKMLIASEMEQLFTKKKTHHSNNNGTSYSYEVRAQMTNGKEEALISGLSTREQALYLEQEIERFIGIEDHAVAGEVCR